jgi:hypothetical protein
MSVIILAGRRASGKTTYAHKLMGGREFLRAIPLDGERPDVPVLLDDYDDDTQGLSLSHVKGRSAPVVICCRDVDATDVVEQIPFGAQVVMLRATHWSDWEKFSKELANG